MGVSHKTQLEVIDGTPEKRFFLSLISDYDLKAGICELIDNAIDFWRGTSPTAKLTIDVVMDADRQVFSVKDNAGGVREKDVRLLIAPGATGNAADKEVIGIFGVGGKRAAIALGERVEIKTRHKREKSIQIDITSEWLDQQGEWDLPIYEVPDLDPGCTLVDVSARSTPRHSRCIVVIMTFRCCSTSGRHGVGRAGRWRLCLSARRANSSPM